MAKTAKTGGTTVRLNGDGERLVHCLAACKGWTLAQAANWILDQVSRPVERHRFFEGRVSDVTVLAIAAALSPSAEQTTLA